MSKNPYADPDSQNEEAVDGARVAANILNRMKAPNKERIMKRINARDARVGKLIEAKMFDFRYLIEVTDSGIQRLLQDIDNRNLAVSLKNTTDEVRSKILQNLSDRRQRVVQEEFTGLPEVRIAEVRLAQRRIMERLEQLRSAGMVKTQDPQDMWV